jgi:hypothetical protein
VNPQYKKIIFAISQFSCRSKARINDFHSFDRGSTPCARVFRIQISLCVSPSFIWERYWQCKWLGLFRIPSVIHLLALIRICGAQLFGILQKYRILLFWKAIDQWNSVTFRVQLIWSWQLKCTQNQISRNYETTSKLQVNDRQTVSHRSRLKHFRWQDFRNCRFYERYSDFWNATMDKNRNEFGFELRSEPINELFFFKRFKQTQVQLKKVSNDKTHWNNNPWIV